MLAIQHQCSVAMHNRNDCQTKKVHERKHICGPYIAGDASSRTASWYIMIITIVFIGQQYIVSKASSCRLQVTCLVLSSARAHQVVSPSLCLSPSSSCCRMAAKWWHMRSIVSLIHRVHYRIVICYATSKNYIGPTFCPLFLKYNIIMKNAYFIKW